MLAQPVLPLTHERIRASLAPLAGDLFVGSGGTVLLEHEGELLRVAQPTSSPFALVLSARWHRRLPITHQARLRDLVDAANQGATLARVTLAITDSGTLVVEAACPFLAAPGASDAQLASWLRNGADAVLAVLRHLDREIPESAAPPEEGL